MAQNTLSSWNFYQGWDVYQDHLVKAIEPLSAETSDATAVFPTPGGPVMSKIGTFVSTSLLLLLSLFSSVAFLDKWMQANQRQRKLNLKYQR
jgi:hypothetical protein